MFVREMIQFWVWVAMFGCAHFAGSTLALRLSFPGTRWCGPGQTAESAADEHLGSSAETDRCCRDHDHCPHPPIRPWTTAKHAGGLFSTDFLTIRLHCECDVKFRDCLRKVNTKKSKKIGEIYFNVLERKCFKKGFPQKCAKWKEEEKSEKKEEMSTNAAGAEPASTKSAIVESAIRKPAITNSASADKPKVTGALFTRRWRKKILGNEKSCLEYEEDESGTKKYRFYKILF